MLVSLCYEGADFFVIQIFWASWGKVDALPVIGDRNRSFGLHFIFSFKVASLRQRFTHSIAPGGLAGDRRGVVPASGFSFSAHQIWKVIKENKDLDLPAHKVVIHISYQELNKLLRFKN